MNAWQIVGGTMTVFGTIFMLFGDHIQSKLDQIFQNKVEAYVADQKVLDAPNLVVLGIKSEANGITWLKVKNNGKKSASNVKVIFTEDSSPSAFSSNLIPGAREIPGSVDYVFPLRLFSGIDLILKASNSDSEYMNSLREMIRKYQAGEVVLIPRFHLEYFDGQKKFTSSAYFLVLDRKHPIYLGKD